MHELPVEHAGHAALSHNEIPVAEVAVHKGLATGGMAMGLQPVKRQL
ncbi:hypothetical protein N602_31480 [Mycobacterium avium subsp. hominissuis 10-5606]|nr:hypothetical protein N602_31480 [Mycobacterium avium subsp. hominissuis 10-5606]